MSGYKCENCAKLEDKLVTLEAEFAMYYPKLVDEKDKRVLAFQAKFKELKRKMPILKHSELVRDRRQRNVLCTYFDLPLFGHVDYACESPDVLAGRLADSLRDIVDTIWQSIKIFEGVDR